MTISLRGLAGGDGVRVRRAELLAAPPGSDPSVQSRAGAEIRPRPLEHVVDPDGSLRVVLPPVSWAAIELTDAPR